MPVITLNSGCTVTLEAIDPASGANVTGVTVTLAAFYGLNLDSTGTGDTLPPEALPGSEPLWISVDNSGGGP